jgi:hypothetical protein
MGAGYRLSGSVGPLSTQKAHSRRADQGQELDNLPARSSTIYRWKVDISPLDFSTLAQLLAGESALSGDTGGADGPLEDDRDRLWLLREDGIMVIPIGALGP